MDRLTKIQLKIVSFTVLILFISFNSVCFASEKVPQNMEEIKVRLEKEANKLFRKENKGKTESGYKLSNVWIADVNNDDKDDVITSHTVYVGANGWDQYMSVFIKTRTGYIFTGSSVLGGNGFGKGEFKKSENSVIYFEVTDYLDPEKKWIKKYSIKKNVLCSLTAYKDIEKQKLDYELSKRQKNRKDIKQTKRLYKRYFDYTNSIDQEFVYIRPGEFMMGSKGSIDWPVHKVILTKGFYIQNTEVTQKQWFEIMKTKPWKGLYPKEGDDYPVVKITWLEAKEFIKRLNKKEKTDKYRLPTEAEWEYVARSGSNTKYCFGNDDSKLSEYAWYEDSAKYFGKGEPYPHKVAQKKPNAWNIFDMHGNVFEWCEDYGYKYTLSTKTDPKSDFDDEWRMFRGGSWFDDSSYLESATRNRAYPTDRDRYLGFRVVRNLGLGLKSGPK